LGICVQIQASLFLTAAGDKGLRLNLADILLPPAGVYAALGLMTGRSLWPRWRIPFGYAWLLALTGVIALALLHSYVLYGAVNGWALTNKFAGWFVLLAYFGLGGWLAANFTAEARRKFLAAFIFFFLVILTAQLALTAAGWYSTAWGTQPRIIQIQGFMGNRNAYAFLACAALIFQTVPALFRPDGNESRSRAGELATALIWFLLPLTLYYNGSRTFVLVAALLLAAFFCLRFRAAVKIILPPLLAGAVLCAAVHLHHPRPGPAIGQGARTMAVLRELSAHPDRTAEIEKSMRQNTSESIRLRVLDDALALWRAHPVLGAGLGSFWDASAKKYAGTNQFLEIIDCTPLWLLTETGLAGLLIFSAFFSSALFYLWRAARTDDAQAGFLLATVFLLICFGLMSLFQELLYTRFLWLILGMGLAAPARDGHAPRA
jgi:O-antigen ligase